MKLVPDMYHLDAFNIPNNEGVNGWGENCTFLLLAESIIFLHFTSFLCSIFLNILQHPKFNPGSAPGKED